MIPLSYVSVFAEKRSIFAMWSIFLASAMFCTVASQSPGVLPLVNISQGIVVGSVAESGYYEFYGIPYADSTSGSHRFKVRELLVNKK